MNVFHAPRTEDLLDHLVGQVSSSLAGDPLDRVCVMVQNRGMARWLELQLAARLGVWANPWFPFPGAFVEWLHRRVCGRPGGPEASSADEAALRWAVAAALPDMLDDDRFEPLRTWLGPTPEPTRLLDLSGQLAAVFDHYLLHAPEMLAAWEEGASAPPPESEPGVGDAESAAWQSELWRAVLARLGARRHVGAAVADELCQCLGAGPCAALERLGPVSVFGVSALSRTYVAVLQALAATVQVTVYTLAPSAADALRVVQAVRTAGWFASQREGPTADVVQAALRALDAARPVHPLVASQAGAVRGFQALSVAAGANVVALPTPAPAPRAADSLLARLQADIVAGVPARPCPDQVDAARVGRDLSLTLHSCHGRLREAEVARDQVLGAFDDLPDLAPHDVLVMVPDVEEYAPYLEAAFGAGQDAGTSIPHRVADRRATATRVGVEAFQKALGVLAGRMTAPEVLDLLAMAPVREARGLDPADVETLAAWAGEAGIRWGLDSEHRGQLGLPPLGANSWRWGLERLTLGWAAPGHGQARLEDTLPYAPAGTQPEALGALLDLVDFLAHARAETKGRQRTLGEWCLWLGGACGQLLGPGAEWEDDRLFVEARLGRLAAEAAGARFDMQLPFEAVTGPVEEALADDPPTRGFLEGTVTICALTPMRAIPFRVVVLVGMNDGVFPRTDRRPDFDLIARRRRLGDTTRREEDRLLFLEAVLSARERLIVTWTGRDPTTDAEQPPSVVVAELLDTLGSMGPGPANARELVVHHPLQPTSSKYFRRRPDDRYWSYGPDPACAAAGAGGERGSGAGRQRRPRLDARLGPPPDGAQAEVGLDDLARFLESPAKRLVRQRLRLDLPEEATPLADREPVTLSGLEQWQVGHEAVRQLLGGAGRDEVLAAALATGRLPLGTPGHLAAAPVLATAGRIVGAGQLLAAGGTPRTAVVDLLRGQGQPHVTGALDGLLACGRREVTYSRIDDKRKLRLWVRHLVLCVAAEDGLADAEGRPCDCPPVSWLVGRASRREAEVGALRMGPVADARRHLDLILALWQEAETRLPPFFPLASREYATQLAKERESGTAPRQAERRALWKAAARFGADRDLAAPETGAQEYDLRDPYLALVMADDLPWGAGGQSRDPDLVRRFQETASLVFDPLDEHVEEWCDAEATAWLAEAGARARAGAAR